MGLDVFTYHCEDLKTAKMHEAEAERLQEKYKQMYFVKHGMVDWDDFHDRESDEAKKFWEVFKKIGETCGMKNYHHESITKIELNSQTDPEHLFKIGYFRSSYNESGINGYLLNMFNTDLYQLFGANSSGDDFYPDWEAAKRNTLDVLAKWELKIGETGSGYIVRTLFHKPYSENAPHTAARALQIFDEALKENREYDYQSNELYYNVHEPLSVAAIVPGFAQYIMNERPCFFLIMKQKNENTKWYLDALKIVVETCDYVLKQKDPQNYYMNWSG